MPHKVQNFTNTEVNDIEFKCMFFSKSSVMYLKIDLNNQID